MFLGAAISACTACTARTPPAPHPRPPGPAPASRRASISAPRPLARHVLLSRWTEHPRHPHRPRGPAGASGAGGLAVGPPGRRGPTAQLDRRWGASPRTTP